MDAINHPIRRHWASMIYSGKSVKLAASLCGAHGARSRLGSYRAAGRPTNAVLGTGHAGNAAAEQRDRLAVGSASLSAPDTLFFRRMGEEAGHFFARRDMAAPRS
jgi:hypothetical protein